MWHPHSKCEETKGEVPREQLRKHHQGCGETSWACWSFRVCAHSIGGPHSSGIHVHCQWQFFSSFLVPNCKAGMTGMMKSLHSKNLSYLGYNPSYKWINPIISYLDISWLPAEIWSNQKLKRPRGHRYPMPFAKHNRSAQSDGSNRPGEDSPRRQFSTSLNGTKRTVAWNPVNPFHVRPIKMASGGTLFSDTLIKEPQNWRWGSNMSTRRAQKHQQL